MINYISARVSPFSIHRVGKYAESEGVDLKENVSNIDNEYIHEMMLKYLLTGFKEPEYNAFTFSSGDETENPLFQYAAEIFEDRSVLHVHSQKIAQYLYNNSQHPNIKSGDFIMCYFEDLLIEDEMLDAIGIFKSETQTDILKLIEESHAYNVDVESGLALGALDKGCLILNTEKSSGYKICVLDKSNKSDAVFWSRDFLNVTARRDEYHFTSHYIQLTKDYVEEKRKHSDNFTKDDELAVMNASEKFFKSNESFNEPEYLEEIFETGVASDFGEFKRESQASKGFFMEPDFDISQAAVKKNNGIFKSVIKLDKNFSLYIHGDRTKIERGEDQFGRKFYKLYYEEEK